MSVDARGYYAALGVAPTASQAVIKAAYRALAKECHPDSGNATDGGARFRFLTEAYDCLTDPQRREKYDRHAGEQDKDVAPNVDQGPVSIDPIRCDECGKVTAQPRRLAFWRVTSFILATHRSPVQKIFCNKCAAAEEWRSTFWTGLLGWWGVPWGPVWSIGYGFKNAIGGAREVSTDEALIWQNAVAFAMRGQGELAVGLANSVRKSDNAELAQRAADLIRFCTDRGVDGSTALKDVWARSFGRTMALLAVAFAMPAVAIAAIVAISNQGKTNTVSSYAAAPIVASTTPAPAAVDAPATSEPKPEPIVHCSSMPSNGAVLTDDRTETAEGHVLTIENGTQGDAIVKVRDAFSDDTLVSFFVRQGQSADLSAIPDGSYKFQYAFGKLGEDCQTFAQLDSAGEFPDTETFSTKYEPTYGGTRIVRGHLSYTLYTRPGGNVNPMSISPAEFNK